MPEQNKIINKPRRRFLGGLVAGLSGTLALTTVAKAANQNTNELTESNQKNGSKGYHESAHIKTYYEKARF